MIYEDQNLKEKALRAIPVVRLKIEAENKFKSYKTQNNTQDKNAFDFNDFLVLELLSWFKNEFFKWVDQPACDYCHSSANMEFTKTDGPNQNEAVWMAGNVEVYKYLKLILICL